MNIRFFLVVILILNFSGNVIAQSPDWLWSSSISTSGNEVIKSMVTDVSGNILVTGYFDTTLVLGNDTLVSAGSLDIFIAKYNSSGNVIWAKRFGGIGGDGATDIKCDSAGNIYLLGTTYSTQFYFGTYNIFGSAPGNIFVAKLDINCNVIWATYAGVANSTNGAINFDSHGNTYYTANLIDYTVTLHSTQGGNLTINANYTQDFYLAKYDTLGILVWYNLGDGGHNFANEICIDADDKIYIGGYFINQTLQLDSNTITTTYYNTQDAFIAKFNDDGNLQWIKQGNSTGDEVLSSMCVDHSGNIYITGYFISENFHFDNLPMLHSGIASNGLSLNSKCFLVKFRSDGTALWEKGMASENGGSGVLVAVDNYDKIYLGANYGNANVMLDTIMVDSASFLISKYEGNGNIIWARKTPFITNTFIAMSIDNNSKVVFAGTSHLLGLIIGSDTLVFGGGSYDSYVAKFDDSSTHCFADFILYPDSVNQHLWHTINTTNGAPPFSYQWQWGDGDTSSLANPTHTYSDLFYYPVTLTITDNNNCVASSIDSTMYNPISQIPDTVLVDEGPQFGGSGNTMANAVDFNNNLIIAGTYGASFNSFLVFGNDTLFYTGLNASPVDDFFIVKYDSLGNVIWMRDADVTVYNTSDDLFVTSLTTDIYNNIYVTGYCNYNSITFGSFTILKQTLYSYHYSFLVKYDANGNVIWVKTATGGDYDSKFQSVATDNSGNIIITGFFNSVAAVFDGVTLNNNGLAGSSDAFIVKYNNNGSLVWAKGGHGNASDINDGCYSITTDVWGKIFISGFFTGSEFQIGNHIYNNVVNSNYIFIAKLDENGSVIWINSVSNNQIYTSNKIAVNPASEVYISGVFYSPSIIFGNDTLLNNSSYLKVFIAKYDANGNVLWGRKTEVQPNLLDHTSLYAMVVDDEGSVYIAGGNNGITGYGAAVIYSYYNDEHVVAKYSCDGVGLWAKGTLDINYNNINSLAIDHSNHLYISCGRLYFAKLEVSPSYYCSNTCNPYYILYPDTVTPQNWYALNLTTGVQPLTYLWNWGDGSTSTGATPSHIFSAPGYYNICLTITDAAGCTSTYCDSSTYIFKTEEARMMISVNVVYSLPSSANVIKKKSNTLSITPNPCNECEIKGVENANDLMVTNIIGKIIPCSYTKSAHGYLIRMPLSSSGIYIIKNSKTGEAIKFVKE